ncbi:excinuclease ABC subunit UvrA [Clostridium ihumii]|uniref:excinuclease ABC subunit UvrA n=1 Tax=Clostridium ihumii TaxID=1470356 RepID=UPI003D32C09B
MVRKSISIKGARANNLKNINLEIPRDALTVITGVSGSGKSSIAYNVLYAEGQRRFLQSLSSSSRSNIMNMEKPDVDIVMGLSPVISIPQKKGIKNPRSSVASMADLSNYIRLLYSVLGVPHCPICNKEIKCLSTNQIAEHILSLPEGTRIEVQAPINKIFDKSYDYLLTELRNKGYRKFVINNEVFDIKNNIDLDESETYKIEVIVDEFSIYKKNYEQIVGAIERGLQEGQNFIRVNIISKDISKEELMKFNKGFINCEHNIITGKFLPKYFSPNDVSGACPTCQGLGTYKMTEPYLLIKDEKKSMRMDPFYVSQFSLSDRNGAARLYSLARHYKFSIDTPFNELSDEIKYIFFYGTKGERYELLKPNGEREIEERRRYVSYEGLIKYVTRLYKDDLDKGTNSRNNEKLFASHTCPDCKGKKLKKERLLVKINGIDINDFCNMDIQKLKRFIVGLEVSESKKKAAQQIINEMILKLELLEEIGLEYLSLGRGSDTLSGGETQRIRLSSQIGSDLMGMMYILDEPSIGLHEKDTFKIINTLKKLRDMGNTVVVVEHDMETIRNAEYIVELGPGAGVFGGEVTACGNIQDVINTEKSITGQYLAGKRKIRIPKERRLGIGKYIRIKGAKENNLKNLNVTIPLGTFICVTGVSGSGKSTLVNEILYKSIYSKLHDSRVKPGLNDGVEGIENVSDIRYIDQSPIGRSSRSNPATYINIYDKIRKIFEETEEAKARGYDASSFSFNNKGGRCENCMGEGSIVTELQFMQDIVTTCPVCKGKRYRSEILEIKYKGKNIADILELTIEDGVEFFKDVNLIHSKLKVLNKLGLGYLKLGQSSSTLSGGEAQRLKLGRELGKIKREKNNLYILDEPTTGLHIQDMEKLLISLNELVDLGNTMLVIEHNLDFIKTADYIIDMGPNAGENGGQIVTVGTPEEIIMCDESYTGKYLKKYIE